MLLLPERRSFLKKAGAFTSLVAAGGLIGTLAAPAAEDAAKTVPLRLSNAHTGESYDVELFVDGGWNANALLVCDHLMRDWRQKQSVVCDRKLYAALYVIQRYFAPTSRIQINSGFRTQATNLLLKEQGLNPATNSQHLLAKAVDFSISGADLRDVARAVKTLRLGGTGLYLSSKFVHMDTRGKIVQWGDRF